jgi:rod shape-determining protein MreC
MRDSRRTRGVLVVLVLVSLTLIALNGNSGPGRALRSGAGAVFGPVQRVAASAFRPIHDFFGGIGKNQQAKIDALQRQNDALRLAERASQYAQCRAGELDALLHIAGLGQYPIKAAQVIAIGPRQGFAWTVEIDAGTIDGLAEGMTVINGDGLVGRVKTVSGSTSVVLLALDPSFNVGARVEATMEIGVASGQGTDPMQVQMLSGQAVLNPGERMVTDTRAGSTFPGGIPIGTLLSVRGTVGSQTRYATLRPFVNFTSLDLVAVILQHPRTDPRDTLLPPRPTPGAAPSSPACGSPSAASADSPTAVPAQSPGGTPATGTTPTPGATARSRTTATPRTSPSQSAGNGR